MGRNKRPAVSQNFIVSYLGVNKVSSEGYHESIAELTDATRYIHRAITSLMEELEAVDWCNQRADVCKDKKLYANKCCVNFVKLFKFYGR
jgi:hypothetical protein